MAVNETTSLLINQTTLAFAYTKDILLPAIYKKFTELVTAPLRFPDMIWIVTPLIITLLLMEFYFGRYSKEELGWNTAVGNSLVLIFVAIDLLRRIYGERGFSLIIFQTMEIKSFIAIIIAIEGFWIMFVDFFHILPKRFAFKLSSSLPINLTAYLAIVFVYSDVLKPNTQFNYLVTFIAAIALFISMIIFFAIVKAIIPKVEETEEEFEKKLKEIKGLIKGEYEEDEQPKEPIYHRQGDYYGRREMASKKAVVHTNSQPDQSKRAIYTRQKRYYRRNVE
jgi:hypothetical protein